MARILIADDDIVQLDLRKSLLESAGHEVVVAFSPSDALRGLASACAALVIIDLRFPNAAGESDSSEGLRLIRGVHQHCGGSPVIVLSGWPEDLYGQPEEKMVSRVMLKPVRSRDLLDAVAELLLRSPATVPPGRHGEA